STDTPHTHSYTPSLHDALPISFQSPNRRLAVRRRVLRQGNVRSSVPQVHGAVVAESEIGASAAQRRVVQRRLEWDGTHGGDHRIDRKSTRLNSSHEWISYAVFC